MKYSGSIEQVKEIQAYIQKTKYCVLVKKTGFKGELVLDIPSTHYTYKLTIFDGDTDFPVSFNYQHRDNYAELWVTDKNTGRFIKLFSDVFPQFGDLHPIILDANKAEAAKLEYHKQRLLKGEA